MMAIGSSEHHSTSPTVILGIPNQMVAGPIRKSLMSRGFSVNVASSAGDIEVLLERSTPIVVILDLMLPDIDGLIVLANIKEKQDLPVIVVSNTRRASDAIVALKLGAEDFISLPCEQYLLCARINVILQRISNRDQGLHSDAGQMHLDDLTVDTYDHHVTVGSRLVTLTPTEYRLLIALMRSVNRVLTRVEIAEHIWGQSDGSLSRSIDVHVRRLRVKLEAHDANCPEIISVRGFGYKIVRATHVAGGSPRPDYPDDPVMLGAG